MKREISQVITFQRDQLNDEIWSVPILQLAKQYGLSDLGLAKICTKMKIPRPPRGYWAKRSYGQPTTKPILRPAPADTPTEITVDRDAKQLAKANDKRRVQKPDMMTERQRVRRLKIALRDIEITRRTRHYLEAMRQLPNATAPDQAEWLDWVARYADHIDPTVDYKMDTPLKSNPNAKVLYKFTAQGFVDD
ncbi:MAG: hypothetical protein K2Q12_06350 [Rickettsiales bacterium]|nr:hypothetical protein [Rickettsiales bacterium]